MTELLAPELIAVPPPAQLDETIRSTFEGIPHPARKLAGPVLVASTDPASIDGALRIAELLARRDRVNAHVLGIAPPIAAHFRFLARNHSEALDEGRRQTHHAALRRQVHQTVGRPVHFSTGVEIGPTLDVIGSVVRARGSRLVVVGLDPKETPHRATGEQLALRAASAGVPVLAVPVSAALLPRRALVAIDFGSASIHAARAALSTTARGGAVTLAFVAPATGPIPAVDGANRVRVDAVPDALHRLIAELGSPDDIDIGSVVLEGEPASALLRFASAGGYDLIAMGSRTTPRSRFRMAGSVSLGLLRSAMGAVLIAPPPEGEQ